MATTGDKAWRVTINRGRLRGARVWVVSWTDDGRRRRRYCQSQDEAEAAADALRVERGEDAAEWRRLAPAERADVLAAVRIARQHGTTVMRVVLDWTAGHRGAGQDCPTLGAAIARLLAAKVASARSSRYRDSLELVLTAFAKGREATPISAVSAGMISDWLATRPPGARATYLARLSTLFSWAVTHQHLAANPCQRVELPRPSRPTPTVLSVRQAAKVLAWTRRHRPAALPVIALTMLAGLRPEEAQRTEWGAVDLKAGLIRVEAQTSKIRQRRVVYPMPSAMAWLAWSKDNGGKLPMARINWRRTIRALRDVLRLDRWPQDVTRHTAATYWLAATGDPYATAEALGHSPAILKTHYRALATKEEAERFWRLTPRRRAEV